MSLLLGLDLCDRVSLGREVLRELKEIVYLAGDYSPAYLLEAIKASEAQLQKDEEAFSIADAPTPTVWGDDGEADEIAYSAAFAAFR